MSADREAGRSGATVGERAADKKSFQTQGGRPMGFGGQGGPRGAFGKPVEKAKDFRGSLKRLIKYLKPHKIRLGIVLVFAIASTLFSLTAPKVMAKAVNKLQDGYMAKTTISTLSEMQQRAVEMIAKQMQGANSSDTYPGQITDPTVLKAIREFMELPQLGTITDADEKADICQRIIDISKMIPFEVQSGEMPEAAGRLNFSDEQINGVIRAIRETSGEFDFRYIGRIILILIGMYLLSSGFSLVMGLVMSEVAQRTVRSMRREVDSKLNRLPLKYYDM
ncbi:MAG: ABC transporter ATP-binding protein, partial [Eubacteriales bacterium]|nr:ABC transporter ATP-binding protein [Eubacteriales bacterium]